MSQPFVLVPSRSEEELVAGRELSTDKVPTSAFEEQELEPETRDTVEGVVFKLMRSKHATHSLEPGKELQPRSAIETCSHWLPEGAAKELPQMKVKDHFFCRV
jgi:hypothetical protein